jgi:hypothetical protein
MQQRMFSRRRLLLRVVAFGLTAICTGFFARFAQAQLIAGDVIGTVTDMSGAVIPGHVAASISQFALKLLF